MIGNVSDAGDLTASHANDKAERLVSRAVDRNCDDTALICVGRVDRKLRAVSLDDTDHEGETQAVTDEPTVVSTVTRDVPNEWRQNMLAPSLRDTLAVVLNAQRHALRRATGHRAVSRRPWTGRARARRGPSFTAWPSERNQAPQ